LSLVKKDAIRDGEKTDKKALFTKRAIVAASGERGDLRDKEGEGVNIHRP
jgi:hypothetical protein